MHPIRPCCAPCRPATAYGTGQREVRGSTRRPESIPGRSGGLGRLPRARSKRTAACGQACGRTPPGRQMSRECLAVPLRLLAPRVSHLWSGVQQHWPLVELVIEFWHRQPGGLEGTWRATSPFVFCTSRGEMIHDMATPGCSREGDDQEHAKASRVGVQRLAGRGRRSSARGGQGGAGAHVSPDNAVASYTRVGPVGAAGTPQRACDAVASSRGPGSS